MLLVRTVIAVAPVALMVAAEFESKFSMYKIVPSFNADENMKSIVSPALTFDTVKPRTESPRN